MPIPVSQSIPPSPLMSICLIEMWIDLETIAQGEVNRKEKKQIPYIIPAFWSDLPCPIQA